MFGLTCTINRYYDPSTDQFLSVDPDVQTTDQPYAFVNDDPLNFEDPLGLRLAVGGTAFTTVVVMTKPEDGSGSGKSSTGKPSSTSTSKSNPSTGPTQTPTTLGGLLNGLASATANAGLALDVASAFDTSSVALTPLDLVTVPASTFVNLVSTASSCASGYANNEAISTVEANCEGDFSVYILSVTQGSPDSVKELATVWGDANTLRNDVGTFINNPPWWAPPW